MFGGYYASQSSTAVEALLQGKLIKKCNFSSHFEIFPIFPDNYNSQSRLDGPRSFDSQDINNLMENPDYVDPEDFESLLEVEKEILEMAKIEEKRFDDDDDEKEISTVMPTKCELPATVTSEAEIAEVQEISVEKDEDQVALDVDNETPAKKKYPVTPPFKTINFPKEKFRRQQRLSQLQKVKDEEIGGPSTSQLPPVRKRKADDNITPKSAETRVKKKKVSLNTQALEIPALPEEKEARQTRAAKRKTVGGDTPAAVKKSKRKTTD